MDNHTPAAKIVATTKILTDEVMSATLYIDDRAEYTFHAKPAVNPLHSLLNYMQGYMSKSNPDGTRTSTPFTFSIEYVRVGMEVAS